MRNLHETLQPRPQGKALGTRLETFTQRARQLYPDSKNNSRRITYGIGCVKGMPSLSPLSSLEEDTSLSKRFCNLGKVFNYAEQKQRI